MSRSKEGDRLSRFGKWVKGNAIYPVYLTAVIGTANMASNGAIQNQVGKWVEGITSPTASVPSGLTATDSDLSLLSSELHNVVIKSLASYEAWQIYSQVWLQSPLKQRQSKETNTTMEQMIKSTVLGSIGILQTASLLNYIPDKINLDDTNRALWINEQSYDLKNRFHLQLANAWIETRLQSIDKKMQLSRGPVFPKPEDEKAMLERQLNQLEDEAKLLEWFRKLNPLITFSEGSYAFFPQWEMINTAQLFKQAVKQGYEIPAKIDWCGAGCLEDRGSNVIGTANLLENTAKIEPRGETLALTHEVGHLISTQKALIVKFAAIKDVDGQDEHQNRLNYVSDYAMKNVLEDFAETFTQYVAFGDRFRLMLEQLQTHKPSAYAVLKQKYDFMKDKVFNGDEFVYFAKAVDKKAEEKEQEFHGMKIYPDQGNRLVIAPNPDTIPGKTFSSVTFPILVGDHFENAYVNFQYNPKYRQYDLIIDAKLFPIISLNPVKGDERISASSRYLSLPKGSSRTLDLNTKKYSIKGEGAINLSVDSLKKVEIGQKREAVDIGMPEKMIARDEDQPAFALRPGSDLLIVEGPLVFNNTQIGEPENYWKIKTAIMENNRYVERTGWVYEGIIGREVIPASLSSK